MKLALQFQENIEEKQNQRIEGEELSVVDASVECDKENLQEIETQISLDPDWKKRLPSWEKRD